MMFQIPDNRTAEITEIPKGAAMWLETSQNGSGLGYKLEYEPQIPEINAESITDQVKAVLPQVSKWRMEELTTEIRKFYVQRYKRRRAPKYGSISKCPSEQQLQAFMRAVDSPKMRLLFTWQSQLGLRIGEVVRVNLANLNLESREYTLRSEKSHRLDTVLIPAPLFRESLEFIKAHSGEIEKAGGYIFFADKVKSHSRRAEGFLEQNYVRKCFRQYLERAKLDAVYDVSDEQGGRTPRKLHRFTTHSLRHYAITRFGRACNGNVLLASKFARHVDPSTTTIYLNVDRKEIYSVVDSIAMSEIEALKRRVVK